MKWGKVELWEKVLSELGESGYVAGPRGQRVGLWKDCLFMSPNIEPALCVGKDVETLQSTFLSVVRTCLPQNWRSRTPQTPFASWASANKLRHLFKGWFPPLRSVANRSKEPAGWLYRAAGLWAKGLVLREFLVKSCMASTLSLLLETSQSFTGFSPRTPESVDIGGWAVPTGCEWCWAQTEKSPNLELWPTSVWL